MIGGGCGRPHDHRPGVLVQRPLQLPDRFVGVGQGDVGSGEDPVPVRHAPVLGQPAVEGPEQEDHGARVVLEGFLVEHAQGGEEPDPGQALGVHGAEAGIPVAVFGSDRLGRAHQLVQRAAVGIAAEIVHQGTGRRDRVEGGIGHGPADLPTQGVVLAPADVDPLDDPGTVGGVEVAGEGIERLVIVIVGVEDRSIEGVHVMPSRVAGATPLNFRGRAGVRPPCAGRRWDPRPMPGPLPTVRRRPARTWVGGGPGRGNRPVDPG